MGLPFINGISLNEKKNFVKHTVRFTFRAARGIDREDLEQVFDGLEAAAAKIQRLNHRIEEVSLDRGFHSPENQEQLAKVVPNVCLPKPGSKQRVEQEKTASVKFHQAKQRHSGVESAIGALQSGNGLVRCRDVGEVGFERYVALAVLGRNVHALGKMLIAQMEPKAAAATSKRAAA